VRKNVFQLELRGERQKIGVHGKREERGKGDTHLKKKRKIRVLKLLEYRRK